MPVDSLDVAARNETGRSELEVLLPCVVVDCDRSGGDEMPGGVQAEVLEAGTIGLLPPGKGASLSVLDKRTPSDRSLGRENLDDLLLALGLGARVGVENAPLRGAVWRTAVSAEGGKETEGRTHGAFKQIGQLPSSFNDSPT